MRILGVDPGLKATGYGVIDIPVEGNHSIVLLEAGTIEPKQKDLLQNKLDKIYKNLGDVIQEHRPEVMVLEKIYSHCRHPATSFILGHARGVICLLCAVKGIGLVEHSVKRIRKAVVGNGNATKKQTQSAVAQILGIDMNRLTLDASDALALALGYAYMQRVIR